MKRWQVYGLDESGQVTHAGTHDGQRMSARVATRIQRNWEKWRKGYLAENQGSFPLRDQVEETIILAVHEIGQPNTMVQYPVRRRKTRKQCTLNDLPATI